jgi:predicted Zn-dependent protease
MRRLLPIVAIVSLLSAMAPAPALALSTESEVQMGRASDEQIVNAYVIETDPLLNAYVQNMADKLWRQVARKDVPYNIKIIKGQDINAFSTLGGYVYMYEGFIDFAQSDDEIAGVIGHETGHIERRHAVTLQSKANALNLLFGIASIWSPFLSRFGNLLEAGAIAKIERGNELQADRTGLQLMARAGYDPDAMLTMMQHLGVLQNEKSDIITKYLEDHPDPGPRASHLLGYPELDPKVVTEQEEIVQAASDVERARYDYAQYKLKKVLAADPNNAEALLLLGQSQLAMGLTSKSEQTLAEAAQKGSAATRAQAIERIASLRQMEAQRVTLHKPNLAGLREDLTAAQQSQIQAATQIQARRDEGRDQVKQINNRLNALQYELPDLGRVNIRHGSRLEVLAKNLDAMARAINSAIEDANTSIGGVGSLELHKESGLLKENAAILKEMLAPLDASPMPAESLAVLPSYPNMLRELNTASGDCLRTVDAARASLTLLDESLGEMDGFFKQLAHVQVDMNGDISQSDYNQLQGTMQKTMTQLNAAANAASQSAQLYNMARTRQLSARITLLGLGTSPQRYASLQYALKDRFGMAGIDYTSMLRDNLTPGDVVVATILAADIKSTPEEIAREAVHTKRSPVDLADDHGMHAWPLEIFTGLVYLDYTDDPVREMQGG